MLLRLSIQGNMNTICRVNRIRCHLYHQVASIILGCKWVWLVVAIQEIKVRWVSSSCSSKSISQFQTTWCLQLWRLEATKARFNKLTPAVLKQWPIPETTTRIQAKSRGVWRRLQTMLQPRNTIHRRVVEPPSVVVDSRLDIKLTRWIMIWTTDQRRKMWVTT